MIGFPFFGFKIRKRCLVLLGVLVLCQTSITNAQEFSGFVGAEARLFANSAIHDGQKDHSASLVAQPEFYYEWDSGSSFTLVPFYRLDSADPERTHFDLRELTYLWLKDDFELRVGVRKVFWGATEVVHLVDVINQTDLVENPDTEDKLGQPMVNLSVVHATGASVDLFPAALFPGADVSRPARAAAQPACGGHGPGAVSKAPRKSGTRTGRRVTATRWATSISGCIISWGREARADARSRAPTDRETRFWFRCTSRSTRPGLDATYVLGEWLWKLEALYRSGQGNRDFFSWTGGFEYTFTRIWETRRWTWACCWKASSMSGAETPRRRSSTISPAGCRLTLNDPESTELLFGWVQDLKSDARFLFLETSRRFGDHWKLTVELRTFFSQPAEDILFDQRADDFLQAELAYYF